MSNNTSIRLMELLRENRKEIELARKIKDYEKVKTLYLTRHMLLSSFNSSYGMLSRSKGE